MDIILRARRSDDPPDTPTLEAIVGQDIDTQGLSVDVEELDVPKNPPLTRVQFERSNCLWPTQFHEDKHIASVLGDKFFAPEETATMEKYMALAMEASRKSQVTTAPQRLCLVAHVEHARVQRQVWAWQW